MENIKDKTINAVKKFENNIYIKAVSSAMTGLMPIMIISSIASLVGSINIGESQTFMENGGILNLLNVINSMTIEVVSLYAAFLVGYKLADLKKKDALNSGIMSLLGFLILTPLTVTEEFTGFSLSSFGAGAMFVAIFGGLLAARLYIFFIDAKLTINLPESVPPVVSKSFAAIIPGLMIALIFGLIALIFGMTPFDNMQNLIMFVVSEPLKALGANIWAVMFIVAFAELLWFFGIHGSMAIYPVIMLVFYQPGLENLAAFSNGLPLPHLFTMGFVFNNRGARSLAVAILCIFQAKSDRMNSVGKIGLVPSLFGISEPIKFGIPQVLNIKMLVPLMLTPAVSVLIAYILTIIGFLPYHNGVSMPLGSPVIIQGFFFNGWQGIVSQLLQLIACILIYIPFIKVQDKTYLEEEKQDAKNLQEEQKRQEEQEAVATQ